MNKRIYRLVLNRLRCMRVPMAEIARTPGQAADLSRQLAGAATIAMLTMLPAQAQRAPVVFASQLPKPAANLPQPYGAATGRTDRTFVSNPQLAPRVNWSVNGNQGTFDQGDVDRVILNWDSFNIGAGYKVTFKQNLDPTRYVSALNRIWSSDPSIILGQLTADREVILVNTNGVYFGRGARVDTGKFVASTLGVSDAVFEKGIRNVTDGSVVFSTAGIDHLPTNLDSAVSVEEGAEIRSAAGGDVLLIAPRVTNRGRIETPQGQTVLAAGDKVYLMSSADYAQRGLIVAVDPVKVAGSSTNDAELGIVENAASGSYKSVNGATVSDTTPDATAGLVTRINEIYADRGSINLVGLTVRQNGALRATTAVRGENGSILLQAQASTVKLQEIGGEGGPSSRGLTIDRNTSVTIGDRLGTVTIGPQSTTVVEPSTDESQRQIDAETFNRSRIRIEGANIHVQSGAKIYAPSGRIEILASEQAQSSPVFSSVATTLPQDDASRIVIDPGTRISAAGLRDVELDGTRNQGDLRLFRIELADAPVQRGGVLYRSRVQFDRRDAPSIEAANVTEEANSISRSARELSTRGGEIRIENDGAAVVGDGAEIDITGGSVRYAESKVNTSLLTYKGRVVRFNTADRGLSYDRLLSSSAGRVIPSYIEGKDGGALTFVTRRGHFGATVNGNVVQGEFQRSPADRAAPSSISFGRSVEDFRYLNGITLVPAAVAALDPSFALDVVNAPVSLLPESLEVSLAAIQKSGVGSVALNANRVDQKREGHVDLGVGGKLDISAQSIALDGQFTAPGGTVTLRTSGVVTNEAGEGDIQLSRRSEINVAGVWTNDLADRAVGVPASRIQTDGGTISVVAERSLRIADGARLDVSAGAWRAATKKTNQGEAGAIQLGIGPAQQLELGASLAGFDFSRGGTLGVDVALLTIGAAATEGTSLAPEFFSSGGFGSVAVRSFGDVTVASGTRLTPQLRNWILTAGSVAQPSGAMSDAIARAEVLDQRAFDRQPVNLTFSAIGPIGPGPNQPGASVHIERGVTIGVEAGGKIQLQGTRSVTVGVAGDVALPPASIAAPSGEIAIAISGVRGADSAANPAQDQAGFVPDQAIWIGNASLSVSGTAEVREQRRPMFTFNPAGPYSAPALTQRVGSVLSGGKITLAAARGYVVTESQSSISLDGFSADIDMPGLIGSRHLAAAAGTLAVSTPEGFVLDGSISARAPRASDGRPLADGGTLTIDLAPGGVSTINTAGAGREYPSNALNPRTIVVDRFDGVLTQRGGVVLGDDLAAKLGNGKGYLSTRVLNESGFEALTLRAGDKLQFATSTRVSKQLGIELDVPSISAQPGVNVELQGPRVALGSTFFTRPGDALPADVSSAPDTSAEKTTKLSVRADIIDVRGNSGLQGFSNVELNADQRSDGEVRLIGFIAPNTFAGQLNFAGDLTISSGQVYATSFSRFQLKGQQQSASGESLIANVTIKQPAGGSTSSKPFSAYGEQAYEATNIVQDGVIRQPLGSVALNATDTLSLGPNSETTVSGEGRVVPFGTTANLSQWLSEVSSSELKALPTDKRIVLRGAKVVSDPSALVATRGGGDTQAWEFFPGVGGSTNIYDTSSLYAVLPDYTLPHAPSGEDGASRLAAGRGTQIEITMAGSALAPGRYTLLPARYALLADTLPRGAVLVRVAPNQGTSVLSAPIRQDDGSTIVTGFLTRAGSASEGTPGQRFIVEPPETFRAKTEVRLTSINDFLVQRAQAFGASSPALPRDAGAIQVSETSATTAALLGRFDLAPAAGGKAGQFDISAPNVALVDDASQIPSGYLGIAADSISSSGAGSVLLGGLRTPVLEPNAAHPRYTVDSSGTASVLITAVNKPVQTEELIASARDSVHVASGVRLEAVRDGTQGARTLAFNGDGALLAVSANGDLEIQRTDAQLVAGTLTTGPGSRLAGAIVSVDSTNVLALAPSTQVAAGKFGLGAKHIAVGESSGAGGETVLSGALLETLKQSSGLDLRSYTSIDFIGDQNFALRTSNGVAQRVLQTLVLDSPTIRGLDQVDAFGAVTQRSRTDIAALDVVLRNTSGRESTAATGQGDLLLEALPGQQYGKTGGITIGPGSQSVKFESSVLNSRGDIVLADGAHLSATGDLALAAARVTATSGGNRSLRADNGSLIISSAPGSRSLEERVGQGAQLEMSALRIVQGGTVDLPGGRIAFKAAGSGVNEAAIVFTESSKTSTAGFAVQAQPDWVAYGNAGQISATAQLGGINALGTFDVGAARDASGVIGSGRAGKLAFSAAGDGGTLKFGPTTQLIGHAGQGPTDTGGILSIDVQTQNAPVAGSASSLDRTAQLAKLGGFTREVDVRVRSGDVRLDQSIDARRIALSADTGSLTLGAVALNASSAAGGVVQLFARSDVTLEGGASIDARSSRDGANGGDVLLSSAEGYVRVSPTALIDARGDDMADGRIVLRAQRGAGNASVNVAPLNAASLRAAEVDVEAVRVYKTVTDGGTTSGITEIAAGVSGVAGPVGRLGQVSLQTDSVAFMSAAPSILDQLGIDPADRQRVWIRAGVEVQASGNLSIASDWSLDAFRPGAEAGFLTLRAGGDLAINNSISDGFTSALASAPLNDNARSWSYRMSAGADLSAANPLATRQLDTASPEPGSLSIAAGKVVRTGAGSIELAAASDILLGGTGTNVPAAIYVAGRKSPEQANVLATLFASQGAKPSFTEQGGRVELTAGRSIDAPASAQIINNWLWRSGVQDPADASLYAAGSHLAWWTEFSRFQQTVGSFGGGNVRVRAESDIDNLSVVAPTSAWADQRQRTTANVIVKNGGDVEVSSGRDIFDGQFMVGRGIGTIDAGSSIVSTSPLTTGAVVLAAMDGQWLLSSRNDASIAGLFNPTATSLPTADQRSNSSGFYYTYTPASEVSITSAAGNVEIAGFSTGIFNRYRLVTGAGAIRLFGVAPPNVNVAALGGNVALADAVLAPSSTGNLRVFGASSVQLADIGMTDTPASLWPDRVNPIFTPGLNALIARIDSVNSVIRTSELSGLQVNTGLHASDAEPVRIAAGASIGFDGLSALSLPKQARITAGQDIVDLTLVGQNHRSSDTTLISAERNIVLTDNQRGVLVAGPGRVEVIAGKEVDLGPSLGITTSGNERNASLPPTGASVKVAAGTAGVLDLPAFTRAYLELTTGSASWQQNRDQLVRYVQGELKDPSISYERALALFETFPNKVKTKFANGILAQEFGMMFLGAPPDRAAFVSALQAKFEQHKSDVITAGEAALAAGQPLVLPGNEILSGPALSAYVAEQRALRFEQLDIDRGVTARLNALGSYQSGWKDSVASSVGSTVQALDLLGARNANDPAYVRYAAALNTFAGPTFERYREVVLAREISTAGAAASDFGVKSLPMRQAFYDQGFAAAELAGLGNFQPRSFWSGNEAALDFSGTLNVTQSSVITRRGGDISLFNAGGAINVGLKALPDQTVPTGGIALGGGNVFGFAKNDFQVNDQRVFIVGKGDMTLWSSEGDIDSGRGANTAVGAPALVARRSVDGIVFEAPATTTGSGLAILPDATGALPTGTIGLFPALGEILALDAFIRAPALVLGSTVRGSDNLISASISGATAPIAAPALAGTAAPPPATQGVTDATLVPQKEAAPRSSLLTVELLGLGGEVLPEDCKEEDTRDECKKAKK